MQTSTVLRRVATQGIAFVASVLISHAADAQFVQLVPLIPAARGNVVVPPTGYLRITMTSQMDPLLSGRDEFYPRDCNLFRMGCAEQPDLVSVTVAITPGSSAGERIELPVALYDVKNKTAMTVAAYQLGRVQYISLEPGAAQPTMNFQVRAVPGSIANEFRSAINLVNTIASNPIVGTLLPVASQVTTATKLLTSFLGPVEQSQPGWKSEKTIGLTTGPLQYIPVDGRVAAIILKPAKSDLVIPSPSELTQCAAAPGTLCRVSNKQVYNDLPYLLLQAEVLPYRLVDGSSLSCQATDAEVARLQDEIRTSALTPDQRRLEESLLSRFNLERAVATGALADDTAAANLAFRWVRRDDGVTQNPLWTAYGAQRASIYDGCFANAITQHGIADATRWAVYADAFQTARTWSSSPPQPATTPQLESYLLSIKRPISTLGLKSGAAYAMLKNEQTRIEDLLVPADVALAQSPAADTLALKALRLKLEARTNTPCERCQTILAIAIGQVDTRLATSARANAVALAQLATATVEKTQLASVRQEAREVATSAAVLKPNSDVTGLNKQASEAATVLSDRTATPAQVRQLKEQIQLSVDSTRTAVRTPPPTP